MSRIFDKIKKIKKYQISKSVDNYVLTDLGLPIIVIIFCL